MAWASCESTTENECLHITKAFHDAPRDLSKLHRSEGRAVNINKVMQKSRNTNTISYLGITDQLSLNLPSAHVLWSTIPVR